MIAVFSKKLNQHKHESSRGSTLIELLVATSVVVVALTALMSTLTLSIKSTAESRYRSYATNLAQEVLEVYRRERALLGWNSFYTQMVGGNGETICLNALPLNSDEFTSLTVGNCTERFIQVGADFSRRVVVNKSGGDTVTIQAIVDWHDGDELREVQLEQQFKEY